MPSGWNERDLWTKKRQERLVCNQAVILGRIGIEIDAGRSRWAMRRVFVPKAPLAHYGQITEPRLGQVTAVVALASLACPDTKNIAVHEPNLIGLTSGANAVYAETGANPRDTEENTTGHRGRDIRACKAMLYEAGFDYLLTASDEHRSRAETFKE